MSASRPPPIRDFASLKHIWGADGRETSNESSEPAADTQRASSSGSPPATVLQPGPGKPESSEPAADSQLQRQLAQAQLLVTDLTERQRSLEEKVSGLEQDLASKDAQVDLLKRDLSMSQEQLQRYAARDVELASLDERERALAEGRASLASDRSCRLIDGCWWCSSCVHSDI